MTGTVNIAPWLGISIVGTLVILLISILRILQLRTDTSAETIRKLFHVSGGAVALMLPWLFDVLWPVLVLSVASLIIFVILRAVPVMHAGPGQILHAVQRHSIGELWFVLGVAAVYAIAGDDVLVYSITIFILALADTIAALVGEFYGKHRINVPGGTKSVEGASTFLLTAFLVVHVPLLLFSGVGGLKSLLIAINVALLAMFTEAIIARGLDNFVVPAVVVAVLNVFLGMETTELAIHFGVIVILGLLVFVYRNRTTLSADALIGVALAGYIFWLFGNWQWLIAPLILFLTYTWLIGRPRLVNSQLFHVDVLLAIVAPGVVLVLLHEVLAREALYLPYVAVWGANLAVIGTLQWQLVGSSHTAAQVAVMYTLKSLVVMIPGVVVGGHYPPWGLAATLLSVPVSLGFFAVIGRSLKFEPRRAAAWGYVMVSVCAGTLISFGLLGLVRIIL